MQMSVTFEEDMECKDLLQCDWLCTAAAQVWPTKKNDFVLVQAASARGEGFVFGISDSDQSDDSPAGGNDDDDDGGRDADRSSRCTTS